MYINQYVNLVFTDTVFNIDFFIIITEMAMTSQTNLLVSRTFEVGTCPSQTLQYQHLILNHCIF